MGKLKLLIADNDDFFRTALAEMLQTHYQVLCCRDGKQALSLLRQEAPDILVLDLLLPKLDGISLLQASARAGILPRVFATTSFYNQYILAALERLDICYLMRKPCDIAATAARILDLQPELTVAVKAPSDPKHFTSRMLLDLRFPANLDGYSYLLDAIPLYAADPTQSLTKELYPAVGRLHNRSGAQVERCIRNAISAAWNRRDDAVWRNYLPADNSGCVPRPTNGAFVSHLAQHLRREVLEDAG